MEHLLACRICLVTDIKLYEMSKYNMKTAYENLTGINTSYSESLQHVCSYCGTMLWKYSQFREKCKHSQQLLETLLEEQVLVTTSHIKKINLTLNILSHPYTMHTLQNYDTTIIIKEEDANMYTNSNYENLLNDETEIKHIDLDNDLNNKEKDDNIYINSDYENLLNSVTKIDLEKYLNNKEKYEHDSDEEPLSKKVKKRKRKKPFSIKFECDRMIIKTENRNNHKLPTNDDEFQTNDDEFHTNDDEFHTNDEGFQTNDNNFCGTEHKLVILSKQEQIDEVLSRKNTANYMNSVYKCDSCFKGFMTESTYKNHMARHDPRCGPVACPVCDTRWPDSRALRAHTLISHERRYICKLCGQTSKSLHKAKEHSQWHAGVTFPCLQCGQTFTKSTSYLTHARLRHATHACRECGLSFIGENGLKMHRKKAHSHRDDKAVGSPLPTCERCHIAFRSTAALLRHSDVTAGLCKDSLHVCAHCGDHFTTALLLKQHTDMHQKTDALRTCAQCSRTFANERSLGVHIQRSHGARSHAPRHCVCEVCGYKCMSASSLVNHLRVHSGEKPHACTLCDKRFSVAQRLQIHIRTHTGERPFQCSRCPKAFKHKAALNRHDRVHTGVKPYACPQCGKRFSQSNSVKQHCAGVHMKTYILDKVKTSRPDDETL